MQVITEEKIKGLMIIFQKAYGKNIDEATAKMIAGWLLDYFKLVIAIEKEKQNENI